MKEVNMCPVTKSNDEQKHKRRADNMLYREPKKLINRVKVIFVSLQIV